MREHGSRRPQEQHTIRGRDRLHIERLDLGEGTRRIVVLGGAIHSGDPGNTARSATADRRKSHHSASAASSLPRFQLCLEQSPAHFFLGRAKRPAIGIAGHKGVQTRTLKLSRAVRTSSISSGAPLFSGGLRQRAKLPSEAIVTGNSPACLLRPRTDLAQRFGAAARSFISCPHHLKLRKPNPPRQTRRKREGWS
jgi:hypothetical protein